MKIKSSRCSTGACVEVDLVSIKNRVHVYDEFGNRCTYTHQEWREFIEAAKRGEFDLK